jgi:bacteriocin-like protein
MEETKPQVPESSQTELDEEQLDQVSGGSKWELSELDASKNEFNPKEISVNRIKFDPEID